MEKLLVQPYMADSEKNENPAITSSTKDQSSSQNQEISVPAPSKHAPRWY